MEKYLKNKISDKFLKLTKESKDLDLISSQLDVQNPVLNLELDLKEKINLSFDENYNGAISCTNYKNLILYDKFEKVEGFDSIIEEFLNSCSLGIKKLVSTKAKLSKSFKTTIVMFVRVDGRITLVDKESDIILLDKIAPTSLDYQRAEKKFMLNKMKFKALKN